MNVSTLTIIAQQAAPHTTPTPPAPKAAAAETIEPSQLTALTQGWDHGLWTLFGLIVIAWLIRVLIARASKRYNLSGVWSNRLTALASALLFGVALSIYRPFEALEQTGFGPFIPIGVALALLYIFRDLVRDFAAAFSVALRGHISPGVQIHVDGREGIVERVGWGSVTILSADGTRQILPASLLAKEAFAVRQPDKITRMSYSAQLERPLSEDELKHIQQLGVLCPYRSPGSPIEVNVASPAQPQGRHTLNVRFQTPSEAASSGARAYLEHHLKASRHPG